MQVSDYYAHDHLWLIFSHPTDNKLQTDTKKKVSPSDWKNYCFLQVQAKMIIKLYGSTVADFDGHATEWKDHCKRTNDYIDHPSFDAIVAMGKDNVVPLVMAEYSQDVGGWWHELMYALVHGKRSGASTFDEKALYEQWTEWFSAQDGRAPA
jgi:hypothetical protein